jgi:hypothetical protein
MSNQFQPLACGENPEEVHIPQLDLSVVRIGFAVMCVVAEDRRVRDDAKQDENVPDGIFRQPTKQRNAAAILPLGLFARWRCCACGCAFCAYGRVRHVDPLLAGVPIPARAKLALWSLRRKRKHAIDRP